MPKIAPVSLTRVFELDGFVLTRERGDHLVYTKPGTLRPLVIPKYDAVPVFIKSVSHSRRRGATWPSSSARWRLAMRSRRSAARIA